MQHPEDIMEGECLMEKKNDHHVPFSLTPEYDRSACKDCRCAFCYQQEFCDHCSHCKDLSEYRDHCYRFEGALNY